MLQHCWMPSVHLQQMCILLVMVDTMLLLLLLPVCRGVPGLLSWLWGLHICGQDQPCFGKGKAAPLVQQTKMGRRTHSLCWLHLDGNIHLRL
jgi:hypothetical protein